MGRGAVGGLPLASAFDQVVALALARKCKEAIEFLWKLLTPWYLWRQAFPIMKLFLI